MTNSKPKKVNFLNQDTYKKLENIWDRLSPAAKEIINYIFDDAEIYQNLAIKKASENDKNFLNNLKTKVNKSKKEAISQIESEDNDYFDLDNKLKNI